MTGKVILALQHLADGMPVKETAAKIGTPYQCLKNTLRAQRIKHDAKSTTHLVVIALRRSHID